MEKFTVRLAGHSIGVESRFPSVREFFADYTVEDDEPEITVSVSDSALASAVADAVGVTEEAVETAELYRAVAEAIPAMGGFVFHGAAISYNGKGYIFTAPSGTGKSTHIREWKRYLGRGVDIVNGDKPIITVDSSGVIVHGTPWAGKERWQKNREVPLAAICFLERGDVCEGKALDNAGAFPVLFSQAYRPYGPEALGKTMELMGEMLGCVPVYSLRCDVSEDAVRCAFELMCGEDFAAAKEAGAI